MISYSLFPKFTKNMIAWMLKEREKNVVANQMKWENKSKFMVSRIPAEGVILSFYFKINIF